VPCSSSALSPGVSANSGQTDYSTANELLSKTAAILPSQYPGMKAISIDWGAWSEVGMSARGPYPRIDAKSRDRNGAPIGSRAPGLS